MGAVTIGLDLPRRAASTASCEPAKRGRARSSDRATRAVRRARSPARGEGETAAARVSAGIERHPSSAGTPSARSSRPEELGGPKRT